MIAADIFGEPVNGGMVPVLEQVIGEGTILWAFFLLLGSKRARRVERAIAGIFRMPARTPAAIAAAPHIVTPGTVLRPTFIDWEQEGWLDPPIEPELADRWMEFEEARLEPLRFSQGRGRRAELSQLDRRVERDLYPGVIPLHEIFPGGDAA